MSSKVEPQVLYYDGIVAWPFRGSSLHVIRHPTTACAKATTLHGNIFPQASDTTQSAEYMLLVAKCLGMESNAHSLKHIGYKQHNASATFSSEICHHMSVLRQCRALSVLSRS